MVRPADQEMMAIGKVVVTPGSKGRGHQAWPHREAPGQSRGRMGDKVGGTTLRSHWGPGRLSRFEVAPLSYLSGPQGAEAAWPCMTRAGTGPRGQGRAPECKGP